MKTSIFKSLIFILNKFLDYFHVLNIAFVIILLILFLVIIATPIAILLLYSPNTSSSPFMKAKKRCLDYITTK